MHTPDAQAIDQAIGEAMGYWQIGDAESMHKYYAEDVVLVSGAWEPPIIGWDNFLKAYQAQRAQVSGARMDRSNTLIKVNGNSPGPPINSCTRRRRRARWLSFAGTRLSSWQSRRTVDDYTEPLLDRGLLAPEPATPMDSSQPGKR